MKNKKLVNLRKKINLLDDGILDLLRQRAEIVKNIGKYKNSKKNIIDLKREEKVIERLISNNKTKYSKDSIVRIWRELFQASTNLQKDDDKKINTKRSINNIKIYKGGKSSIVGKKNIIKLSSNENSYGPTQNLKKLVDKNKFYLNSKRYPDIDGIELRKFIGKFYNIDFTRIVLGCGSDENLLFAALAFCQDGDEIIHSEHGFEMYSIISKIVGATIKNAKEDKDYNLSINSICNSITVATKLIYLANPNNPTGTYLSKDFIVKLMKKIPKNIIVVLDGAYAEYVMQPDYDKGFSLVDKFHNLIITRTFSKVYGLAGLRIGWCYSSKKVAKILNKVKGPFNTTSIAQEMAISALKDQKHIKKIVQLNLEVKTWFEKELHKLNINTKKTEGNFSFIKTTKDKARKIANHLASSGIIVRQLDSYNLPNCLRITIGTKKEMKRTIDQLKNLKC